MKLALRNRRLHRNSICYTDTKDVVSLLKMKGFDKIGNTNNIVLSGFSFMDGFKCDLPPKEQCLVAAVLKNHNIVIFKLKI
uniref:Uncharacterized protein n=1 Tax=Ciona intestinalis TaxID=7719 RepID=H2XWE2_CIOIN